MKISFIRVQIQRERRLVAGQGWGKGHGEQMLNGCGVMIMSWKETAGCLYNIVNVLNVFALKWLILCYMNLTSIENRRNAHAVMTTCRFSSVALS